MNAFSSRIHLFKLLKNIYHSVQRISSRDIFQLLSLLYPDWFDGCPQIDIYLQFFLDMNTFCEPYHRQRIEPLTVS